jgi:hypothetical protein
MTTGELMLSGKLSLSLVSQQGDEQGYEMVERSHMEHAHTLRKKEMKTSLKAKVYSRDFLFFLRQKIRYL